MWCPRCQTQVAGIASPREHSVLVCAKCQTRLDSSAETSHVKRPAAASAEPLPGLRLDTHRMQTTLGRIDRLVQRFEEPAHFDDLPELRSASRPRPEPALRDELPEVKPDNGFPWLASISLAGGVMLLVCGCFLIVWSVVTRRPELFNIGFPIAVVSLGCMALAACLFFQEASGRQAETQKWLADVQNQLGGIREIANNSRHSLGSIPELPSSPAPATNERLVQSEERLNQLRRRLNETRRLS
ncbi:hypothetical protein [Bremerella cremea]|uniref:hypothetical protein n=1 Tax=Bremerella cremea TaxID=1031537 RepID=UPI0031E9D723